MSDDKPRVAHAPPGGPTDQSKGRPCLFSRSNFVGYFGRKLLEINGT